MIHHINVKDFTSHIDFVRIQTRGRTKHDTLMRMIFFHAYNIDFLKSWQLTTFYKDVVVAKSNFHRRCFGMFVFQTHVCIEAFSNVATWERLILTTKCEISHLHFIFSTHCCCKMCLWFCVFTEDVTLSEPFHGVRYTLYPLPDFTGASQSMPGPTLHTSNHDTLQGHRTHYTW